MEEFDFNALGFSLTEIEKKWDYGYELRSELRRADTGDFIAWVSTTTRTAGGEQVVNTSSSFVQHNSLTLKQIDVITAWLRQHAQAARWRLTTYTVLVEARS